MKEQSISDYSMKTFTWLFLSFLVPFSIPFSKPLDRNLTYERLEYEAKFGFINLGNMVLEISDTMALGDKEYYLISSRLNSNPDLNFIFSLNDTIEVITTIEDLLPLRYEKRLHEGKYVKYEKMEFFQESLFVTINDSLSIENTEPTRDLLSFWYYLRRVPLTENDTLLLAIFEAKQQHRIECLVGKKEVIKTPLGKFATIKVTPQTKGKGVFGASGSMDIWYSNDENRYPVQIKTKLKFGTVVFKLKGVSY